MLNNESQMDDSKDSRDINRKYNNNKRKDKRIVNVVSGRVIQSWLSINEKLLAVICLSHLQANYEYYDLVIYKL